MQEQATSSRPSSSERSSSSAHHMDMEVKEGKLPIFLCHPPCRRTILCIFFIRVCSFGSIFIITTLSSFIVFGTLLFQRFR